MPTRDLTTQQWINSLMEPGQILLWAFKSYITVNAESILNGQILAPLLYTSRLRDEAFGRFWVAFSTNRESDAPPPPPIQNSGEIQGSSDLIPPILAHASGIVLDVGPGTGSQMPLLRSPAIQTIYGAEPCHGLHAELRARAISEGLSDKYHILPCGVEAADLIPELQKQDLVSTNNADPTTVLKNLDNIGEGVFDTVICIRVLCSVPDMQRTIKDLYTLLRPGGKLLVVEHVVNPWRTRKGSVIARGFQVLYELMGWRLYMGNCCLNRDTAAALKMAAEKDGGWESFELERSFESTPMPYISGVLVRKGGI